MAGSGKYLGAAVLSAQACARTGSGYVTIAAADGRKLRTFIAKNPDFLMCDFDAPLLRSDFAKEYSAIAVGPGLGKKPAVRRLIWRLIKKLRVASAPVVLDADALNTVAQFYKTSDGHFPSGWIMTPHEAELSRLLKVSAKQIHLNREKYVQIASAKFGCLVILKGDHTLIASQSSLWMNTSGNSALAKAGTGDVLTGIITGLLAQNVAPEEAAKLGVYLHGLQADRWIKAGNDHLSLLASDLVSRLPKDIFYLRKR